MALHSDPTLDGHEVISGVYFSSERDVLESLVMQQDAPCRIFSGYAGWGGGQLDEEMRVGGWLTMPAQWDHIFGEDGESLWRRIVNTIGDEITRDALRIRHVPSDPSCN